MLTGVFDRPDRRGLLANVALTLVAVIVVNGLIFGLGWNQSQNSPIDPSFAPPGWVIGLVWIVLFGCMGAARWLLVRRGDRHGTLGARGVVALLVACLIFPFYTALPDSAVLGLVGTIMTLMLAVGVAWYAWRASNRAALLVGAVVAWLSFASVLSVRIVQLNA
jgi:translocator protein